MSSVGRFITETFEYDGGRDVTVYVPEDAPEAIVFAGDGQLIARWGGGLAAAGVPPTMIVGVHRPEDETFRLQEYSLGFDPHRFAVHEAFLIGEVRRWVEPDRSVAVDDGADSLPYGNRARAMARSS